MKVKDVIDEDIQAVNVPGNRDDAIELLRELRASSVPVLKEDSSELVGMVSLRDLFENPDENQIGMLVNRDIASVNPEHSLEEAARAMIVKNERRLPVLDKDKLTGIVTVRGILSQAIAERKKETTISEFMQTSTPSLWEKTPLNVAVEILNLSGERALPVLDNEGELSGIIGDEDIINVSEVKTEEITELMRGKSETEKWAWDNEDRLYITKRSLRTPDKEVSEIMTTDVITVTKRSSASKCAKLMEENDVHQLPVISARKIIGMITDEDLLKVLTE